MHQNIPAKLGCIFSNHSVLNYISITISILLALLPRLLLLLLPPPPLWLLLLLLLLPLPQYCSFLLPIAKGLITLKHYCSISLLCSLLCRNRIHCHGLSVHPYWGAVLWLPVTFYVVANFCVSMSVSSRVAGCFWYWCTRRFSVVTRIYLICWMVMCCLSN